MAGYILHQGAIVACKHPPGLAVPNETDTRVTLSGMPLMTVVRTYTIGGCNLSSSGTPCATGAWSVGAQRVTASGFAVAISNGVSACIPTGTPLDPKTFQQRVTAS